MSAAAIRVPAEFTAVDKFTSVVKKMTAGVSRFTKDGISAMERFDSKINRSISGMNKISKLAVGLGIGALFTSAIKNNIDYNDSLASVKSITGSTTEEMIKLEALSLKTAKSQKMLGSEVNKAYELVGSAQPALLKNTKLLDSVTNSAITLSKAGKMELTPAVEALTTTLNQFGLDGTHAADVIDNLAAGSVAGASNITQTADAIKKFGTNAAAAGIKVNESIALIQLASPFEKGAEAGTKLRNILRRMSGANVLPPEQLKMLKAARVQIEVITDKTKPLKDRLLELSKVSKNSDAVSKIFGTDAGLAQGLFDNAKGFGAMLEKVNESNVATKQAKTNTTTLDFALKSIKNSFLNTTTATNTGNSSLTFLIDILNSVGNNMDLLVGIVGALLIAFGTLKGVLIATKVVTAGYNLVLGINTALTQTNKKALIGNTLATSAYKVMMIGVSAATKVMTAAQWLLNIAMDANPIGLIILGVAALIGLVVLITQKYDEWGASLLMLMGPLGWIINLIVELSRNWDFIKKSFSDGGIIEGLKAIGNVILLSVLNPMKQFLGLIAKIPVVGKLAQLGLDKIGEFEANSSLNGKLPSPETQQAKLAQATAAESKLNGSLDVTIKDKGGNVENVSSGSGNLPINLTPIQGMIAG